MDVMRTEAWVNEMFTSLQGEGAYVGLPQFFIRFCECNLRCGYCDTKYALEKTSTCRVEMEPGGPSYARPNPLSVDEIMAELGDKLHLNLHSVSLTGGEPLLHVGFLESLLPILHEVLPVYLDTNGTLAAELERVASWIDVVAMDVKLHSVTGVPMPSAKHEAFLRSLNALGFKGLGGQSSEHGARGQLKSFFVKIVVGEGTDDGEIDAVATLAGSAGVPLDEVLVILQPVARVEGGPNPPSLERLLRILGRLGQHGLPARVIPQTHKVLRVR